MSYPAPVYPDFLAKMKVLADANDDWQGDPETAHIEADRLLCDFLRIIGYYELALHYDRIGKWYA